MKYLFTLTLLAIIRSELCSPVIGAGKPEATKDELLKTVKSLEALIQTAIDKNTYPSATKLLESEIKQIKILEIEVTAANTELQLLEVQIRVDSYKKFVLAELSRLDGITPRLIDSTASPAVIKEELLNRVKTLMNTVQKAIDQNTYPSATKLLESEINQIKLLEGEVAAANTEIDILEVKVKVDSYEKFVQAELIRLGGVTPRMID